MTKQDQNKRYYLKHKEDLKARREAMKNAFDHENVESPEELKLLSEKIDKKPIEEIKHEIKKEIMPVEVKKDIPEKSDDKNNASMLGIIGLIAGIFLIYWFLKNKKPAETSGVNGIDMIPENEDPNANYSDATNAYNNAIKHNEGAF